MIRVVLVHPGEFVLPELGEQLGRYASRKLAKRGVEIRSNAKIKAVTSAEVELTDGTRIKSFTLVWTAGAAPHPLLEKLPLPKERQRLKVNAAMGVEGYPGVWALGDCAMIPDKHGGYQPPTAQHASREGKVLAHNIIANTRGKDLIPFQFNTLGLLASIGRRTGVARILGINFSGFVAWWLWRTIEVSLGFHRRSIGRSRILSRLVNWAELIPSRQRRKDPSESKASSPDTRVPRCFDDPGADAAATER